MAPPILPYELRGKYPASSGSTPSYTAAIAIAAVHVAITTSTLNFYDPPTTPLRGAIMDSDRSVTITA